jgi:hypothetical protein
MHVHECRQDIFQGKAARIFLTDICLRRLRILLRTAREFLLSLIKKCIFYIFGIFSSFFIFIVIKMLRGVSRLAPLPPCRHACACSKSVTIPIYPVHYGKENASPSAIHADRYVIILELLDSVFNILPVSLRRWEVDISYLHGTFLPLCCLHKL